MFPPKLLLNSFLKLVRDLLLNFIFSGCKNISPQAFMARGLFFISFFIAAGCTPISDVSLPTPATAISATPVLQDTVQVTSPSATLTVTPEKPSPTEIDPTPTETMLPPDLQPTAEAPLATEPEPWFTRPAFPNKTSIYALVRTPASQVMYGSLGDAANAVKEVYRFAYDLVYVEVLEEQQAGGVDFARVLFDGQERWIRSDALELAAISTFSGVILNQSQIDEYGVTTLGLVNTDSLLPAGLRFADPILVYQNEIQSGLKPIGGAGLIDLNQVALVPLKYARSDERYPCRRIVVDISSNSLAVYDEDCDLRFATLISTGVLPGSTPTGIFRIASKEPTHTFRAPPELRKTLGSYIFENVPYTLLFSGYYAIHSVYWHDSFGSSTSHGCVNLSLADAEWLFNWVEERDYLFIEW